MSVKSYAPHLNNINYNFSSRDCLGIESVSASISAELCPIVNTVTPRAFYWPFMTWIYYDFLKNSGITDRKVSTFDEDFLKHQDYYFVLASIIDNHPDDYNLVGKQITKQDYKDNPEGPYYFNKKYFKTRYGGMQYYNAGCLTMRLITQFDEKNEKPFGFPRITQFGEEMALAFEDVIKDTGYYKRYRLKNEPVPKEILEEYGNVINLSLKGFDECKSLLRHHLFEVNTLESIRLWQSAQYLQYIYSEFGKHTLDLREGRKIFYDYFSPRALGYKFPPELQQIIVGWEMVIGRQYLTCGIEMIWKYMLYVLNTPVSFEKWADLVIDGSTIKVIKSMPVKYLIAQSDLNHEERERMVAAARQKRVPGSAVEDGMKIALSVYKRFKDRDDLGETAALLDYGRGKYPGTGSLSFNEWIAIVEEYKNKSIEELLVRIMKSCIVDQHKRTCYDKLTRSSQSIDGFYFECIDDLYIKNEHEFQVDFQGIRLIQLMQVMKDLDMFERDQNKWIA